ncbi:MAG: HigA family addiction module antidote protein [Bacteroidales bacterium]|jgi:addiction module HigA family antidote|nr:HigA family addiction module antidote protein [Bacteroidales bacterium]
MIKIEGIDPRMIANNITPYRPIHPGEIIKDEIEYRGISQRKLATQMGVSYTLLNEVLNGKRSVNTELAMLVEAALDIDAGVFIRMQADYNMQVARKDKTFVQRLAEIRKMAAML